MLHCDVNVCLLKETHDDNRASNNLKIILNYCKIYLHMSICDRKVLYGGGEHKKMNDGHGLRRLWRNFCVCAYMIYIYIYIYERRIFFTI